MCCQFVLWSQFYFGHYLISAADDGCGQPGSVSLLLFVRPRTVPETSWPGHWTVGLRRVGCACQPATPSRRLHRPDRVVRLRVSSWRLASTHFRTLAVAVLGFALAEKNLDSSETTLNGAFTGRSNGLLLIGNQEGLLCINFASLDAISWPLFRFSPRAHRQRQCLVNAAEARPGGFL